MAVLCLLTNTPWPWPTPAEAASARGGFPTLGTEWRGRSEAEVCTSEARKIRVLLARARGGASQEVCQPHWCANAHIFSGRCGVSPLDWGVGRRGRLLFAGVGCSWGKGIALTPPTYLGGNRNGGGGERQKKTRA